MSRGLKGALSGKYYNRSWLVHECFAEETEKLFINVLIDVQNEDVLTATKAVKSKDACCALFAEQSFVDSATQCNEEMTACLNSQHGKAVQF